MPIATCVGGDPPRFLRRFHRRGLRGTRKHAILKNVVAVAVVATCSLVVPRC
jgi:hypothetical protein